MNIKKERKKERKEDHHIHIDMTQKPKMTSVREVGDRLVIIGKANCKLKRCDHKKTKEIR